MSLAEGDDLEVVLPQVVMFVMNVLVKQPELRHLLQVAGFELPESDKMIQDHLGPIFDLMVAYFKKSAERQTIRDVDPILATLGLVGIVVAHQTLRTLFTQNRLTYSNSDQEIAAYVDMYLHGLQSVPDLSPSPTELCASNQ